MSRKAYLMCPSCGTVIWTKAPIEGIDDVCRKEACHGVPRVRLQPHEVRLVDQAKSKKNQAKRLREEADTIIKGLAETVRKRNA